MAVYMAVCLFVFGAAWLREILPATLVNGMPPSLLSAGLSQSPVWVLDFAFTFPVLAHGGLRLWRRRVWGIVVGGMIVIMLTIETAGITIDQYFGHVHDPSVSLDALPLMVAFTAAGLLFSILFLQGLGRVAQTSDALDAYASSSGVPS